MKRFSIILLVICMLLSFGACVPKTEPTNPSTTTPTESISTATYDVVITDYVFVKDYDNKDAIVVYMNWTNKGEFTLSFNEAIFCKALQSGGNVLTDAIPNEVDDLTFEYLSNSELPVYPNNTVPVAAMFTLYNTTDNITIEIYKAADVDAGPFVTGTYTFD